MPAYNVDLVTDRGLQRVPFTLDDDRPLGPQVTQVLAELRQQGVVLKGGPDDELGVFWNGRDLDLRKSPQALALTPLHSVELRMRRRPAVVQHEQRTEPPARSFLPKGSYIGTVAGLTGAGLGWFVSSLFTDLGTVLSSYGALDLTVAGILGAGIGAAILGTAAARRTEPAALGLLLGAGLGGLGALLGSFIGLLVAGKLGWANSRQGFIVARLLVWGLTGGLTGLALGIRWVARDRIRLLDGLLYGLGAGVLGGLLFSLPGPSDLWQMLAFALIGTGLGYGLTGPGLKRSLGVLELETVAERSTGLLGHREWEIADNGVTSLGPRFQVEAASGRLKVLPTGHGGGEPAQLAGRPLTAGAELLNLDTLAIGDRRYRFRRFPQAGV
ncbi:MAG: hypothetical protein ABI647_18040 [Gemmatimonadota bacterium]